MNLQLNEADFSAVLECSLDDIDYCEGSARFGEQTGFQHAWLVVRGTAIDPGAVYWNTPETPMSEITYYPIVRIKARTLLSISQNEKPEVLAKLRDPAIDPSLVFPKMQGDKTATRFLLPSLMFGGQEWETAMKAADSLAEALPNDRWWKW